MTKWLSAFINSLSWVNSGLTSFGVELGERGKALKAQCRPRKYSLSSLPDCFSTTGKPSHPKRKRRMLHGTQCRPMSAIACWLPHVWRFSNWTRTPTSKIRGAILPSRAKRSGDADTVSADGQSLDSSGSVGSCFERGWRPHQRSLRVSNTRCCGIGCSNAAPT